jgi:hypothetical protein
VDNRVRQIGEGMRSWEGGRSGLTTICYMYASVEISHQNPINMYNTYILIKLFSMFGKTFRNEELMLNKMPRPKKEIGKGQ